MLNEMNPGSFTFGPLWWAIFIAIAATFTMGVMCLFLWQASKEPLPRSAVHQRIDRSPEQLTGQLTGQHLAPEQVAATEAAVLDAPLEDEIVDLLAQSPVKTPA